MGTAGVGFPEDISEVGKDAVVIGNVEIILRLFLFSKFNFSFVILEPFLKFIKYMLTEASIKVKAVKKL